jgi:hypothetical protein
MDKVDRATMKSNHDKIWESYNEKAREHDRHTLKEMTDALSVLLIFVSLGLCIFKSSYDSYFNVRQAFSRAYWRLS